MNITVNAAAVTPFTPDGAIDRESITRLMAHLSAMGLDGALLTGTTGEAASLSVKERAAVYKAAREATPGLTLIAGTAATALNDVLRLNRAAFDAGLDAVAILPPFFYEERTTLDLYAYYVQVIEASTPHDGRVLLYHNPNVTDVHITPELALRLRERFPRRVVGMKNSSGDAADPLAFLADVPDFEVLVGSDELLTTILQAGGAGAITGAANLYGRELAAVAKAHHGGGNTQQAQAALNAAKKTLMGPPRIAAIKYVLKEAGVIACDAVRLPLRPLTPQERHTLGGSYAYSTTDPGY
jgi:4-hydroxy-tetrahydrodipicolinate synthase